MNDELDLTIDHDFRHPYKPKEFKHPYRTLPWERGSDDECVSLKKSSFLIGESSFHTSSISWTSNRNDMFSTNIRDFANNQTFKQLYFDYIDDYQITKSWNDLDHSFSDFPTGKRDKIRKEHEKKRLYLKTKKKSRPEKRVCCTCGCNIANTPWNNEINEQRAYQKYFICYDCYEQEETIKRHKKLRKKTRERLILPVKNDKQFELSRRLYSSGANSKKNTSVPCLSSEIEALEERMYPYRWNDIKEYMFYIPSSQKEIQEELKEKKRKRESYSYASYYKGKRVRNGLDPLQPSGRIRQEYDQLFDQLSWRRLLSQRIGEEVKPLEHQNTIVYFDEDELETFMSSITEFNAIDWF